MVLRRSVRPQVLHGDVRQQLLQVAPAPVDRRRGDVGAGRDQRNGQLGAAHLGLELAHGGVDRLLHAGAAAARADHRFATHAGELKAKFLLHGGILKRINCINEGVGGSVPKVDLLS